MKKILLITIFLLLLQSFNSFGNPNGKGIICKCVFCNLTHIDISSYVPNRTPTEIGFFFKNDTVSKYFISKINDEIKMIEKTNKDVKKKPKFYTDENEIKWTSEFNYILDRKTLDLSEKIVRNGKGSISVRTCQVLTESIFFKKMEELSIKYQNVYNKKIKDNKI